MWPAHDLPTPDPKQKRRDFILGIVSREFSLSDVTAVEHLLQVPSAAGDQRPVRPPDGFLGPCTPSDGIKIGDEPGNSPVSSAKSHQGPVSHGDG